MHVLINGAGIAGPTLAWFLAKTGSTVTVLERSPSLRPHGQSVDITSAAVKIVQQMGLLEKVRHFNTSETGTRFLDARGSPYAVFPVDEETSVSLTSPFEILRGDLAKIFYEAVEDLPNVTYMFDTTVSDIISNDEDGIMVVLSNGEHRRYDLLVAADGQRSHIREQCFPEQTIQEVDMGMYVTYWTLPRVDIDSQWWEFYTALESRTMSLRPDPYGTMRTIFTIMPNDDETRDAWKRAIESGVMAQKELVRKEYLTAGWQASRFLDALDEAPDFYFQAVRQIRMSSWSHGRVVCVGDAAYCPTPISGMGTSLAIVGAYILAGEFSKIKDSKDILRALRAYEKTLRPYVASIQNINPIFPAMAHPGTATKRWLFQSLVSVVASVFKAVSKFPWLANKVLSDGSDDFILPDYPVLTS